MNRPRLFLTRMILFLLAVIVVCGVLFGPLQSAFMANAPLNGLILGVLLLGIVYNFRQVVRLYPEVTWIDGFRSDLGPQTPVKDPKLLAPMATMLGERGTKLSLSALAMRSLLDGIASRLDESRDISRYTIGLLIFLGLLGTFWGLLETISSISDVIGGLSAAGGNLAGVFDDLKRGLEAPLSGMGTAFSSSLFGLAGSLVLGFLDLQAGQAQNRFFNDLEEWLSSLTRLSSGALPGDGDHSVPAYVQALLEQTAESLENLQRTLARGEDERNFANTNLTTLMEKLGTLSDHMRTEQTLMMKLAESQMEMKPILLRLANGVSEQGGGMDESTRTHIRNLDVYVARLLEELGAGREEIIQQLRSEIKLLARTVAAASAASDLSQR
ncbi:MAG: flagellar motor protein MotA [Rhodospirillales bacterium]|nr:flagellar motor protein MotA [Rhodospirillales bacterium]